MSLYLFCLFVWVCFRSFRTAVEVLRRSCLPQAWRAYMVPPLPGTAHRAHRRVGQRLAAAHRLCRRSAQGSLITH